MLLNDDDYFHQIRPSATYSTGAAATHHTTPTLSGILHEALSILNALEADMADFDKEPMFMGNDKFAGQ